MIYRKEAYDAFVQKKSIDSDLIKKPGRFKYFILFSLTFLSLAFLIFYLFCINMPIKFNLTKDADRGQVYTENPYISEFEGKEFKDDLGGPARTLAIEKSGSRYYILNYESANATVQIVIVNVPTAEIVFGLRTS